MITAICGWWGIPAFFFAWHALLRNLTGGVQPRKANEELRQALKQQDMYFRSNDPSPQKIRGAYAMRGAIPALLSVGAMTLLCTWGSGSDSPDVARTTTATQHQTRVSTEAVALQRESFTLESEKSALDKEVSRLSNQEAALDSLDGVIERLRSSYEYNAPTGAEVDEFNELVTRRNSSLEELMAAATALDRRSSAFNMGVAAFNEKLTKAKQRAGLQ
jgi:hypothetical protein